MIKRLLSIALLLSSLPLASHAAVFVSIDVAPPPLPVYAQPVIPAPGYIWTPGYWRWNAADGDYYWIPGTWVTAPYVGALWTPGYWGWGGGAYAWHGGYWGTHVGFYGGVNYGFGYGGHGYEGGYWNGGVFNYNRSVNNVNTAIVRNVYNTTVVQNNTRVSFNGGQGGVAAQPTQEERAAQAESHTPPTPQQRMHEQVALRTPAQRASVNHGTPQFAATAHAGERPDAHGGGGDPGRYRGDHIAGVEPPRPHAAGEAPRPPIDHPHNAPQHEGRPQEHREGGHGGEREH